LSFGWVVSKFITVGRKMCLSLPFIVRPCNLSPELRPIGVRLFFSDTNPTRQRGGITCNVSSLAILMLRVSVHLAPRIRAASAPSPYPVPQILPPKH
jgi:hypothetical protein